MNVEITTGRAKESGHWYQRDGSPCYEIRGANGKMRPVDLRDARKLGLLPGITSILAMEAKPQLEMWKRKQIYLSTKTLPGIDKEEDEAGFWLVEEDAKEQARKAAARGTLIHAAIQGSFEGKPVAAEALPYVTAVHAWIAQRFGTQHWIAEQAFASPFGFGTKIDLHRPWSPVLIDFKGKDFDESKQGHDLAWPDNCMQLAAERYGFGFHKADCVNIFFSRTVPGLIRAREWDENELEENWEAFQCLHRLWSIRRKYNPSFERKVA